MKWVKPKRYYELSGDTEDAVQKKIARGVWLEGVQFKTAPDGCRWFNTEAIDQWVENGVPGVQATLRKRTASGSGSSGASLESSSTSVSEAPAAANA